MAFGTFDIFHKGHEYYLESAKKRCYELTVVVAREKRILERKKRQPIYTEEERVEAISRAFPEYNVILWDNDDILMPIRMHEPEVVFFWYDQEVPEWIIREQFPGIAIEYIDAFEPNIYKSSLLRKDHKKNWHL